MEILEGYLCGVAYAVEDGVIYRHTCFANGARRSDVTYGMPDDALAKELLRAFQLHDGEPIFDEQMARNAFRRFAAGFSAEELREVLASVKERGADRSRGAVVADAFLTSAHYLEEYLAKQCRVLDTRLYAGGTVYRAEGGVVYRCENSGYATAFKDTPWYAFPEPPVARRWLELYLDAPCKDDLEDLFGEFKWELTLQEVHDIAAGCFELARQHGDPDICAAYRRGGLLFRTLFWDKWYEDSYPDTDECERERENWEMDAGWNELDPEGGDLVGMPCVRTYGV
jgi:hypothetical protein